MDSTNRPTNPATTEETPKPKARRGFAAMDPEKVKAIAQKGGVAVHAKGTAHRFSKDQAREAGRKGGMAPHRARGRARASETVQAATPVSGVTSTAASTGDTTAKKAS